MPKSSIKGCAFCSKGRILKALVIIICCSCYFHGVAQDQYSFQSPELSIEKRVQDLVSLLTMKEKVALLQSTAEAIPRLGVKNYYHGNEGLHGVVKGGRFTVFPQAIGLSATWNSNLVKEVATAISDEARAKWNFFNQGKDQKQVYSDMLTFWSPTINMARDPRWGRTPETYGEDPFLTSSIGVSFVKGLQGDHEKYIKVVATPKHFVANNQEENRLGYDAKVSEKALREYYFPAYKAAIIKGDAQAIMSAYNAINGVPSTANSWLLNDVLRKEWGFKGYVVSDCGAVTHLKKSHDFVSDKESAAKAALEAGLDLECGEDVYPNYLLPAYHKGLVEKERINTAVSRILTARFKLGIFDSAKNNPYTKISPDVISSKKHQELAVETARQSIVLLKNKDGLLPLDKKVINKIAVVGFNANNVVLGDYSGLPVIKPISPLQGIINELGDEVEITHVRWKTASKNLTPIESEYLSTEEGVTNGLSAAYYNNKFLEGTPKTRIDKVVNFDPVNQPPDPYTAPRKKSIRWTGFINPQISGNYKIGVNSDDGIRLWLNNKLMVDEWHNRGATTDQVDIEMIAGEKYGITLEYFDNGGDANCKLLWKVPTPKGVDIYEEDKKAARENDYVIAVMGINKTIEREGTDRETLALPRAQVDYLKELYAINENIVVVLVAGSSLAINWIDKHIPAIVDAWYPGESGGKAIADVLFGNYNPAGRLPLTFYKSLDDLPPMNDYEISNGRTYMYFEGEPLYPFGYGLSYSKFTYSKMKMRKTSEELIVSMKVKNTGSYKGDEVVQLYYRALDSSEKKPLKKLIGFERKSLVIGESKTLTFKIPLKELQYWNENQGEWQLETGRYEFMLGASSSDIRLRKTISLD